jgi:hypothetical protein
MKAVDNCTLARWRSLDAAQVLGALADYAKKDLTFTARADPHTTRWHAHVAGRDVEILCTGPKFWDMRAERGGGGAVDLVMHLFSLDFKDAVQLLRDDSL